MVHDLILVHTASAYLPMPSSNSNGNLTTMKGWDAVVTNDVSCQILCTYNPVFTSSFPVASLLRIHEGRTEYLVK